MACSICGTEGHNRSTCPRNPQLVERRWAAIRNRLGCVGVVLLLWLVSQIRNGVDCRSTSQRYDDRVNGPRAPAPPPDPAPAKPKSTMKPRPKAAPVRADAGWIEPLSSYDAGLLSPRPLPDAGP